MSEHIPDVELSLFAHDPAALPRGRAAVVERHTARCEECGARMDFYSVAEEDLYDPTVWEPAVEPAAPVMGMYALQCAEDDAEADELLAPYFENPARAAWTLLRRREFYTGGVVRKLNARAHEIVASTPRVALTHADHAQVIADALPDDTYPNSAVYELRGTAWKERANALLRLGELNEALESLRRAERAYQHLRSSGHGLAAVELVRAVAYYQMGEFGTAAMHAERSEHAYAHLGQESRRMKAVHLRGSIKLEAGETETAALLYQQVIDYGEMIDDPEWIAKGACGRANCELDLQRIGEALMLFTKALAIFREQGPLADRVSTEWGLARAILQAGNASDAVHRLRTVVKAFEDIGMVTEAALASLDVADGFLVLGHPEQIEKVAAHAFRILKKAGILTGASMALAYLEEVAAARRVDREVIGGVRKFLRQTEHHPQLLFVPPPDTFR
jgi:tetratricopeptide (TPR) repeat protein